MGDRVHSARDVRKAQTRATEAFRGFPRESLGLVSPSALEWFGAPWRSGTDAAFAWSDDLPEVVILYAHAGLDAAAISRQLAEGTRGIVIAGVGEGNMPESVRQELARLAARGVCVVRASRADEGLVDRLPSDDPDGFVAARALGVPKARLLTALLIANGITEPAEAQRHFDGR